MEERGDFEEAKRLYTLAAERGDAFAQYNLGVLLYNKDDIKGAIPQFILSAKQGNASAQSVLKQLNINYTEVDPRVWAIG